MLIELKNIETRKSDGSYLDLYENIYNFDVFDFISDISIDNMRIDRNDSIADFIADKIKIKYDYLYSGDNINIKSINNSIYLDNIKYYFKYDFNLIKSNTLLNSLNVNTLTLYNNNNNKIFELGGKYELEESNVNLSINTMNLNYYDILIPGDGSINVSGKNYIYNVDFMLHNVKNMVKTTLDQLSGNFIFTLKENEPLINFLKPIEITDKLYKGVIKIKKINTFDDLFYPDIEVITKSINPFNINKLDRIE